MAVSLFNLNGHATIVDLTGSNDSGTTGIKTSDFVYLFAHFANSDASQSGVEEWALVGFFAVAFATHRFMAVTGAVAEHNGVRPGWTGDYRTLRVCLRRYRLLLLFFIELEAQWLQTIPRRA
jgi:hypothetical protein